MSEKYEKRKVRMPLSQPKVEKGTDELAKQTVEAITGLPLEQRYVWRIGLIWGSPGATSIR